MNPVTEGIWEVPGTHRFPGGVVFPLRCTLVTLADGLWMHSPVPFDERVAAAIDAVGPVRHIVAPSRMHDLHTAAAAKRWPEARLYAPASLLADHRWEGEALEVATWPGLRVLRLAGAERVQEFVFLHEPSSTLLVTDLLFHFGPAENLATALMRWAIGCSGRCATSRSWRWVFADDLDQLRGSVSAMMDWPFDRLIPCHGRIVATGAHAVVRAGLTGRIL